VLRGLVDEWAANGGVGPVPDVQLVYEAPDDGLEQYQRLRNPRTNPVHGPRDHEGCLNAPVVNEVAFVIPNDHDSQSSWRRFATTLLHRETTFDMYEYSELCAPFYFILLFPYGDRGWSPLFWRTVPPSQRADPVYEPTPPVSDDDAAAPGRVNAPSDDDDADVPVSNVSMYFNIRAMYILMNALFAIELQDYNHGQSDSEADDAGADTNYVPRHDGDDLQQEVGK
jgi:hypothetical protein